MPFEEYTDDSAGLFGERYRCRVTGDRDMATYFARLTEARQPEAVLQLIEDHARLVERCGDEDDPIRQDAEYALFLVAQVRKRKAECDSPKSADGLLLDTLALGSIAERMRLRLYEKPAEDGMETLYRFRGEWIKVTRLEKRILEYMDGKSEAPMWDFVARCWGKPYDPEDPKDRGKIDAAIHRLNSKLESLGVTLNIRREGIILG